MTHAKKQDMPTTEQQDLSKIYLKGIQNITELRQVSCIF